MPCLECQRIPECHDECLTDMQLVLVALRAVEHGHLHIAQETLEQMSRRLSRRHLKLTGREIQENGYGG